MADEIRVNALVEYEDEDGTVGHLGVTDLIASVSTLAIHRTSQQVGIVRESVKLGEFTALGYAVFVNRDDTNIIKLETAGPKEFAVLQPNNGIAILYLGADAQTPTCFALVAECKLDIFILPQ